MFLDMSLSYVLASEAATQATSRPAGLTAFLTTLPDWFSNLLTVASVAHIMLVLCIVSALGMALGMLKFRGISLGIGGVLFAGIALAHYARQWGIPLLDPGADPKSWHVLHFVQEFGLILFVYTIGIQVGPGFFSSLRRDGLKLNLMAASIVVLGAIIAVCVFKFAKVPLAAAVGLFSGATTNTPSLQAAAEALKLPEVTPVDQVASQVAMQQNAYAMAYPFGILGIIFTMLLIRGFFKISLEKEQSEITKAQASKREPLAVASIEVKHVPGTGMPLFRLPEVQACKVTISRILKGDKVVLGAPNAIVKPGDVLHVVGPTTGIDRFRERIGVAASIDVRTVHSPLTYRKVLVTKGEFVGSTVDELELLERHNVTCTRVIRGDISMSPMSSGVRIAYGDALGIVGEEDDVQEAATALGNSVKALNHPQIVPIFVAIALGVILGSWAIPLPNLPAPVKLGLAGGPLVVALILSRISKVGPLIYYLPQSANLALREIGIVLFLACVGLNCGGDFVRTLTEGDGLKWMGYATLITFLPIAIVGFFARIVMKTNFMTICGLLSGSMTDPPALAFAGQVTGSDAPSVAYSTVYPLTMILRIFLAQTIVLVFARAAGAVH